MFAFRVFLGITLVCAGGLKIYFSSDLAGVLRSIAPSASKTLLRGVSVILPPSEIGLGILWILPWDQPVIGYAGCTLFGIFVLSTMVLAIRRSPESCNCFGDFMILSPWRAFFRSLALFLLALLSASSPRLVAGRYAHIVIAYLTALSIATISLLAMHAREVRRMRIDVDESMT